MKNEMLNRMLVLSQEFNNDEETNIGDKRYQHNEKNLKEFWSLYYGIEVFLSSNEYYYLQKTNGWKDTVRRINNLITASSMEG